jgi:hypothetical protein
MHKQAEMMLFLLLLTCHQQMQDLRARCDADCFGVETST